MLETLKGSMKAVTAFLGSLLVALIFVSDNLGGFLPDNVAKPLALVISAVTGVLAWFAKYKPAEPAP